MSKLSPILNVKENVMKLSKIFDRYFGYDLNYNFYNNTLHVCLWLNEHTYSKVLYYVEQQGLYKQELVAVGQGTNSNLGNYTGTMLFHLQLLLMSLSNVVVFRLYNMTDNPERAARGIYSLLKVDKTNKSDIDFTNKTLSQQLYLSEGEMYLVFQKNTRQLILDKIDSIFKVVCKDNLNFRYNLSCYY